MSPTRYGVAAIFALLPTCFAVAFTYQSVGIHSVSTWLPALVALALFVAAEWAALLWRRARWAAGVATLVAAAAAGSWWAFLFGLAGASHRGTFVHVAVPSVYLGGFILAAVIVGVRRRRQHTSARSNTGPAYELVDDDAYATHR